MNKIRLSMMMVYLFIPFMLFSQMIVPDGNGIVYVNQSVLSPGNGDSWADAAEELADALEAARTNSNIKQIWVAAGTYAPKYIAGTVNTTDRDKTFLLPDGISIYGGFTGNGNETTLDQRDFETNKVVLRGIINDTGTDADSVYHVVLGVNITKPTMIDGVTITGGNANVNSNNTVNSKQMIRRYNGSGIYLFAAGDVILSNIIVTGNGSIKTSVGGSGGGICLWENSKATMKNVCFENNLHYNGGAIYNYGSVVEITDSKIINNVAQNGGGGIYTAVNASTKITNSVILNNTQLTTSGNLGGGGVMNGTSANFEAMNVLIAGNSARMGGGIYNSVGTGVSEYGVIKLTNATIAGNTAFYNGGGIYTAETKEGSKVSNCIIWGNNGTPHIRKSTDDKTIYSYSLIEDVTNDNWFGGINGGNNIDGDPYFTNVAEGDYRLTPFSSAVNRGNNDSIPANITTDLAGNPRIYNGGIVDMGAYELQGEKAGPKNGILYVSPEGDGLKYGNGWEDAFEGLADALVYADSDPDVKEIWLKEGTYKPKYLVGSRTDERGITFLMRPGINIYGGFKGDEADKNERTGEYEVILSGVIGDTGTEADSVYHVVVAIGDMKDACLDGVTITGGKANGSYNNTFTHNNVYLNLTESNGGGVYLHTVENMLMSNVTVTGNYSRSQGGGMYIVQSKSELENIRVENNYSNSYGGGITIGTQSTTVITNAFINHNIVGNNGLGGGMYNSHCAPVLKNITIAYNSAGNGGGVYNDVASPVIIDGIITENVASYDGGGIYNHSSFSQTISPELTNVHITKNSAGSGGGIYTNISVTDSWVELKVVNALIAENTSTYSGGGMYNNAGTFEMVNSTVTNNQSGNSGSGMYNNTTSSKIRNSIIWGNGNGANNILKAAKDDTEISHSLIERAYQIDGTWNTSIGVDKGGNIASDPLFTDVGASNYTLKVYSPAVNKGDNDYVYGIATDLDGNARIYNNGIVDMGAYERQGTNASPNVGGVIFVSENGAGDNLGNSWEEAIPGLVKALAFAESNPDVKELWIQAGTYTPEYYLADNTDERNRTFLLPSRIHIYGGFEGNETKLEDRKPEVNEVILSGIIGDTGTSADSVYHVVMAMGNLMNARIDGVTITGGSASGSSSFTVDSKRIYRSYGGGIYLLESENLYLSNIRVRGNRSTNYGGGAYLESSTTVMENIHMQNNYAVAGGAIYNVNSSTLVTNALITDNLALNMGGGIYSAGTTANLQLFSLLLARNKAANGGGMYINNGNFLVTNGTITENQNTNYGSGLYLNSVSVGSEIRNSIIWNNGSGTNNIYRSGSDNTKYSYSLIQGCYTSGGVWNPGLGANSDGGNNIASNPRFIDQEDGNYRLSQFSPARNSGNNDYYNGQDILMTDLDGNPRFHKDGVIDLGAYEAQWNSWLEITNKTVPYNGQPQSVDSVYVQEFVHTQKENKGEKSWVEYQHFDLSGQQLAEPPSLVGIYKVVASFEGNSDFELIVSDTVVLTIEKAPVTLVLQGEKQTYTGDQLHITPAVLTGTFGNVPGVTYKYVRDSNTTDSALEAGNYVVTAYFAGDANHEAKTSDEVEFEVEKAQPVINITVSSMTYTGEPIEINQPTLSGSKTVENLLPGLKYSFINDSGTYGPTWEEPTDADSYKLTVSTEGDSNHKPAEETVQFTIDVNVPTLSLSSRQVIYNGQPVVVNDATIHPAEAQHLLISYKYSGRLKDGTNYPETETAPVNAGDYKVTASTDGDGNFAPVSISASLEIMKKESTISMENKSTPFTGNPISIDPPVTDPVGVELIITYEGQAGTVYEKSTLPPTAGGSYLVTALFAGDNNHSSKTATANLTIANAGAPVLRLNNKVVVYDGSPQPIGEVQISPEEAKYLEVSYYYSNANYEPSQTPPTDAGIYSVTASTPADENFTAGSVTATLTIDKADQVMNFPAIPARQLGDAPFNLGVTVNTNLPITYQSGNPSIATVSDDGMVTILRSGSVTLTARQAGTHNYNEVFRTQLLNITSNYVQVYNLMINGQPVSVSDQMHYDLGCSEETEFIVEVQTEENATVDPGKKFTVTIDKPMLKVIEFTVTSQDMTQSKTYRLTVERRFIFDAIVKTRWNNTLTVINNPDNNGGYTFSSYKWYRNGEPVGEGQSYSAGSNGEALGATDHYYVEVTSADFEGVLRTCEEIPAISTNMITAYPNPVNSGNIVCFEADIDDYLLEEATIDIYAVSGVLVKTVKVTGKQTFIQLTVPAGSYQLKLNGAEGFNHEMKIMVK